MTADMQHDAPRALSGASGPAILIRGLTKDYGAGRKALDRVDLEIYRGEIFALLGPNGAGKTTLISIVCGIVNASEGTVLAEGHDVRTQYREARRLIGLVPQELSTDAFETVMATVRFSRGLFGKAADASLIERILRDLSLWERRDSRIMTLSGGMKRRVMIAKALSHEPRILFLDEPTAGVDVELRRDMWTMVRKLRDGGVTIVLTTHYIQEAEEMADRVGVINQGRIILVEPKAELMRRLGKSQLLLQLDRKLDSLPDALAPWHVELSADGSELAYGYDVRADASGQAEASGVPGLLKQLDLMGLSVKHMQTRQSSLEDIFVSLVHGS
jgi:ABC-2 type transport system ATP-binding protein